MGFRRNFAGDLEWDISTAEFRARIERWRKSPEAQALFAKIAADRTARIEKLMAKIDARQK